MYTKNKFRLFFCAFGIICVGIGICSGEPAAVFRKAVKICLECIGIG